MTSERVFLTAFFRVLNKTDVRYAVLRNYESLPDSAGGSDLDILVSPDHEAQAKAVIFQAIEQVGGVPVGCAATVGFYKVYALGRVASHPQRWWGLRLDVSNGLFFDGAAKLLDFGKSLRLERHNDIAVLPSALAAILGVLKEVLHGDRIPTCYIEDARNVAVHDWPQMQARLHPMGRKALSIFHEILLADADKLGIQAKSRQLRKTLRASAFVRQPLTYMTRRFLFEWSKVQRYLRPSGVVIAVLGVDGAGKSTVINAILSVLNAATHNAVFVQHLRPGFLPPLARLKGKADLPSGPVLDPHGSTPSGVFGSLFRLSYLTLDYILGYWLKIRPMIAKQPAVVLYDRYAYDMALDPRRFCIDLPGRVAGWFARLAPKPDLILCLHAGPEVIAARKQELPLEETRRQVEALRDFAQKESRAVLISTEGSVDEVREQVLQTLHDFFAHRAKNDCKHG